MTQITLDGPKMTQNGSKLPKNDISEMSRFTRFARHKFSAARHLKLFCTPGGASAPQHYQAGDTSLNLKTVRLARRPRLFHLEEVAGYLADSDVIVSS